MKHISKIILSLLLTQVAAAQDLFEIQKLGSRSYFVKTKSGKSSEAGSNSGFIVLKDSILVIDAHISPEAENLMIGEIKKISSLPIRYLVITHPHKDHNSGEPAHAKSVVRVKSQGDLPAHLKIRVLDFGSSHSSRDLVVFDEVDRVAFMGDLYVNGYVGYLAEANFKNWIRALESVEKLAPLKIAPGHGKLSKLTGLTNYRTYLQDFVKTSKAHFDKTKSESGYKLPAKYEKLGARFFLENNIKHAFKLWEEQKL